MPGSQVPPDHLKPPPVLVLHGFAANQFNKLLAIFRLQSQPGESSQNYAPGAQSCRNATVIACPHLCATVALDP